MSTEQQNTPESTQETEQSSESSAETTPKQSSSSGSRIRVQLKGKSFVEQMAALSPNGADGFEAQQAKLRPSADPLQMKGAGVQKKDIHDLAAQGTQGSGGDLPHLDAIQTSFGKHDVTGVQAHTGGAAADASKAMGAEAYASGNSIAFGSSPGLHTAAHEAAHIVQQRAGVSLKGGVGEAGDSYEQHADTVADAVVAGQSAEGLLDTMAGGGKSEAVQSKAVQMEEEPEGAADAAGPQAPGAQPQSEWEASGNLRGNPLPPVRSKTPVNTGIIEDRAVYDKRLAGSEAVKTQQGARAASMLGKNGKVTDFRYFFAQVYEIVSKNEIRLMEGGSYYYPSYVGACVLYFDKLYEDNFKAFEAGGYVEEHWKKAFESCASAQEVYELADEGGLEDYLPGGIGTAVKGGKAAAQVLAATQAMVVCMQAHIRYDLPRAEAWVFNSLYAHMPNASIADFHKDFMAMGPVFDAATTEMMPIMAKRLGLPVHWTPQDVMDIAMTYMMDADMAAERADTWERAEALANEGLAGQGPYATDESGDTAALKGDTTQSDNMSMLDQTSDKSLHPSMDSSREVMDDDAARAATQTSLGQLKLKSTAERIRLIHGMLRGNTRDNDEIGILKVLLASAQAGDLEIVVNGSGGAYALMSDIGGAEATLLLSFLKNNYYGRAAKTDLASIVNKCCDGYLEWNEEMTGDVFTTRPADAAYLVAQCAGGDAVAGYKRLTDALDGADWDRVKKILAQHAYPKMGVSDRAKIVQWLCEGLTLPWATVEIFMLLRTANDSDFTTIVNFVGYSDVRYELKGVARALQWFEDRYKAVRGGGRPASKGAASNAVRTGGSGATGGAVGGRTQRKESGPNAPSEPDVQAAAAQGVAGSGGKLPHLDTIQGAFGKHDVSNVQAHTGGAAADASKAIGAKAYATGNDVAFADSPDLHTSAHEAAHIVQQRAGVSLKGGVGKVGDQYEQHADMVAELVVQGKNAEGLLDEMAGSGKSEATIQRAIQREPAGGTAQSPAGAGSAKYQELKTRLAGYTEGDHSLGPLDLFKAYATNDVSVPEYVKFGPDSKMTKQVRMDEGADKAREDFYATGNDEHPYSFGVLEFAREAAQASLTTHMIGSYTTHVTFTPTGGVLFVVENSTGLESMTRNPITKESRLENISRADGDNFGTIHQLYYWIEMARPQAASRGVAARATDAVQNKAVQLEPGSGQSEAVQSKAVQSKAVQLEPDSGKGKAVQSKAVQLEPDSGAVRTPAEINNLITRIMDAIGHVETGGNVRPSELGTSSQVPASYASKFQATAGWSIDALKSSKRARDQAGLSKADLNDMTARVHAARKLWKTVMDSGNASAASIAQENQELLATSLLNEADVEKMALFRDLRAAIEEKQAENIHKHESPSAAATATAKELAGSATAKALGISQSSIRAYAERTRWAEDLKAWERVAVERVPEQGDQLQSAAEHNQGVTLGKVGLSRIARKYLKSHPTAEDKQVVLHVARTHNASTAYGKEVLALVDASMERVDVLATAGGEGEPVAAAGAPHDVSAKMKSGKGSQPALQLKQDSAAQNDTDDIVIVLPDGTRIISAVEGHSIENKEGVTLSGGSLVASTEERTTSTDADGTARGTGRSTSASANLSGGSATHSSSTTEGDTTRTSSGTVTANVDGTVGASGTRSTELRMGDDYSIKESTTVGATGNVAEGQVGGNVGYSRDDGGIKTSASASGNLDFDSSGRLEGAGGNVKMGHDGVDVSFGGSFKCSAQPPVQQGNEWVVTWVNQATGSASGGLSNDDAGATASLSGGSTTTGSRRFANRGAALRFFASGDWALIGLDDAGSLGAGETITDVDSHSLAMGASAKLAGITVGGTITIGGSTTVEVTGLGEQHVNVKLTESVVLGGAVSLSNGIIGMQFGGSTDNFHGAIVKFDLSTPAGDRAYDLFVEHGHVSSNGCELVAKFTGETNTATSGVTGPGGASVTNANTATDEHYDYADGHTVDRQTGTESVGASIPLVGSHSESDSLAATHDSSTGERTYSVTNTVTSSDTESVNRDLAQSTGREASGVGTADLANQSSRTWTVSSQFTQSDIRRLVEAARAGRFNSASLIYESSSGRTFVSEVSAAGTDWDRIDNALQHFIAETGDSGLRLIRDTISVRPQQDLVLEGDPYMTGAAGHARLARNMERYEAAVSSGENLSGLVGEINTALTAQRERLAAISNRASYPDLPDSLRYEEVQRTQREVERLDNIRESALTQLRSAREEAPETETPSRSSRSSTTTAAPVAEAQPDNSASNVQAGWDRMMVFETKAEARRSEAIEIGNEALRQEWIHNGAYCFSKSARDTWGGAGGWITSEGSHLSDYSSADNHMANGRRTWTWAENARREYDTAKAEVEVAMATNPADLAGTLEDRLGTQLSQMYNWYGTSQSNFDMAATIFTSIQDQHPEGTHNQFQGRNRRLPSSQRLNQGG
jgi:hypothetical protein